VPVAGAGPAYVATLGGVLRIDVGSIEALPGIDEKVAEFSRGPGGAVFTAMSSVYAIRGANVDKTDIIASSLGVGPDGTLYWPALLAPGIELRRAGKQENWSLPATTYHVVVGSDGTVIAADEKNRLYQRTGEAWRAVELDRDRGNDRLHALEASASGTLYAIFEQGVVARSKTGAWTTVPLNHGRILRWGEPSSEGSLPLSTDDGIIVLGDDGAKPLSFETIGASKGSVQSIGVDDQKRRWIGTSDGLKVFDREGKLLQTYAPGTLPGPVHAILVVGSGPALPPPPPVVRGTIVGRLLKAEQPLANTRVELCHEPTFVGLTDLPSTPCSEHALRLQSTTDREGRFTFKDAPRHEYRLAYESAEGGRKKWRVALGWKPGTTCCADLKQDAIQDVGDLSLR
jgi:hypothetical protein